MIPEIRATKSNILIDFGKVPINEYYNTIIDVFDYISNKYQNIKPIKFENCSDVNEMILKLCSYVVNVKSNKVKNMWDSFRKVFKYRRCFYINDVKWYSDLLKYTYVSIDPIIHGYFTSFYFIDDELKYFDYSIVDKLLQIFEGYRRSNKDFYISAYYGGDKEGIFVGANFNSSVIWFNNINLNFFEKKLPSIAFLIKNNNNLKFIFDKMIDSKIAGAIKWNAVNKNNIEFFNFFIYDDNFVFNVENNYFIVDYEWYKQNKSFFDNLLKNEMLNEYNIYKFVNVNEIKNIDDDKKFILYSGNFSDKIKPLSSPSLSSSLEETFKRTDNKELDSASNIHFRNFFNEKYRIFTLEGHDCIFDIEKNCLNFYSLKSSELDEYLLLFYNFSPVIDFDIVLLSDPIFSLIKKYLADGKDIVFNFGKDEVNNRRKKSKSNYEISLTLKVLGIGFHLFGNLKNGILIDSSFLNALCTKDYKENARFFYNFLNFIGKCITKLGVNMGVSLC